jgi:hypothetical protein
MGFLLQFELLVECADFILFVFDLLFEEGSLLFDVFLILLSYLGSH